MIRPTYFYCIFKLRSNSKKVCKALQIVLILAIAIVSFILEQKRRGAAQETVMAKSSSENQTQIGRNIVCIYMYLVFTCKTTEGIYLHCSTLIGFSTEIETFGYKSIAFSKLHVHPN